MTIDDLEAAALEAGLLVGISVFEFRNRSSAESFLLWTLTQLRKTRSKQKPPTRQRR